MINLNDTARKAFETAIRRKKTAPRIVHHLDACGFLEEIDEFQTAGEDMPSEHIPPFTEAQEELADILITALTELYKRGTDIEAIITLKMKFNQQR